MYACITQRSVPTAGAACCDIPDVSPRKGTPRARQQVKTGGPDVQTRAWPMDMDARVPIQIDMNEVTCGGPFKSLALACRLKARIIRDENENDNLRFSEIVFEFFLIFMPKRK
jgi:hypothetical protein